MDVFLGLVVLALMGAIYFLPSYVAYRQQHRQRQAIYALNLLGGWTMIGWVGAFVWAMTTSGEKTA